MDDSYAEQTPGDKRHFCISRDNEAGVIIVRPNELYELTASPHTPLRG